VIKSVWTNVWLPALCINTVILAVCRDFQCKILLICEEYFLYSSLWEAPVQSLTSSLATVSGIGIHCRYSHSLECRKAAPLQHLPYAAPWHANDTCRLTLTFVTSWFIFLWLTKLFNLTGFRQSLRSRVLRCPSYGQYCPFDDTSLEQDWCFGNSISYPEILLQSEYQSILFQWNTQQ